MGSLADRIGALRVGVADLPETTHGEFLYCAECDGRYSATRGDYFWMGTEQPFLCGECNEPMILATERREIVPLAVNRR